SFHATGTAGGKRYVRGFQKPMIRRADALLAVAEEHKRYLVDAEGLDARQITVIHNGVDPNRYRPGPAPDELARELGFDGSECIVIAVGSLKPLKGFDFLLRAAAGAFANRKDLRLVIVGDGAERNSLEALSESLGVRDRVTFTGVRRDVDALLRMSDLLVLSSWTEAFPNVVLEAMATGLPVISTDVGSVREVVREGENGLIVPPKDVDALNSALRSMLADPGRMATFGEAGRKIVEESFRLEDMCRKRERVFANILC
ncbi:MAG: glycosyltransferase family 4 protein, partial [bacterium]|nr:glycosyltransferase family 4 protein [bacterium]